MMIETSGRGNSRARRRTGKRRHQSLLQIPATGRFVALIMAGAGVVYFVISAITFLGETSGYANVFLSATPDEVQYFAGKPTRVRRPEGHWLFVDQDMQVEVRYRGGRVEQIACEGRNCAPSLGVRVDQPEVQILNHLGRPNEEFLTSGRKIMRYTDIGYDLVLQHSRLERIVLKRRTLSMPGVVSRFLVWALP